MATQDKRPLTPEEEAYLEKQAEWQLEEMKLRNYLENYEPDEDEIDEEEEYLHYNQVANA